MVIWYRTQNNDENGEQLMTPPFRKTFQSSPPRQLSAYSAATICCKGKTQDTSLDSHESETTLLKHYSIHVTTATSHYRSDWAESNLQLCRVIAVQPQLRPTASAAGTQLGTLLQPLLLLLGTCSSGAVSRKAAGTVAVAATTQTNSPLLKQMQPYGPKQALKQHTSSSITPHYCS